VGRVSALRQSERDSHQGTSGRTALRAEKTSRQTEGKAEGETEKEKISGKISNNFQPSQFVKETVKAEFRMLESLPFIMKKPLKLNLCLFTFIFTVSIFNFSCRDSQALIPRIERTSEKPQISEIKSPEIKKVLESAAKQIEVTKNYDPNYVVIPYPNGDVPMETGVCSDVVIRAFRAAGVDLQKEIHEDMKGNFAVYPKKWNLPKPDANIDHRRVPNLQKFFERKGKALPITENSDNYKPGDVVSWDLNGKGLTHIGIVSNIFNAETGRYSIIHNIGAGARAEDVLFDWKITGHYRYF
jgi:uncharacterized protein YijF (DUF1287 family)